MSHWRRKLKENEVEYQEYLRKDAERARCYRAQLSKEQRIILKEKTRDRVRKWREKKKTEAVLKEHKNIFTRNDKKIQEEQKEKWKTAKQQYRQNMSAQKKRRVLEKRRKKYHEKNEQKMFVKITKVVSDTKDNRSGMAKRKALQRARSALPEAPQKYAATVVDLVEKSSPRKRKALEDLGVNAATKKSREFEHQTCRSIKECIRSLKGKRKEKDLRLKRTLAQSLSLTKKYKYKSQVSRNFGISWKLLSRKEIERKARSDTLSSATREKVSDFYEDQAIYDPEMRKASINKPSMVSEKTSKDLHEEFCKENPENRISLSKFSKLRPNHVKCCNTRRYRGCLCEYCTNIELKIKCVNNLAKDHQECKIKDKYHLNRVTLCESESDLGNLSCNKRECDKCSVAERIDKHFMPMKGNFNNTCEWKKWENTTKTKTGKDGRSVKQTKKILVKRQATIQEMVEELKQELEPFSMHLFNATWQSRAFKTLKKSQPERMVIQVLDFAENFTCFFQDEIQSAHWNHELVTVHPIVNYYRCESCTDTITESVVFISEDLKHDFHAVNHFVKMNHDHIKNTRNIDVDWYVQWTDGCASQYKSKGPFMDISNGIADLGCIVERNFFGSRHGKGPSDGESAVIKRKARAAVKSQGVIINNAKSLFEYCQKHLTKDKEQGRCTHFLRTIFWIEEGDIDRNSDGRLLGATLKGTRSLHSIRCMCPGKISSRKLSCYCEQCLKGELQDCGIVDNWKINTIVKLQEETPQVKGRNSAMKKKVSKGNPEKLDMVEDAIKDGGKPAIKIERTVSEVDLESLETKVIKGDMESNGMTEQKQTSTTQDGDIPAVRTLKEVCKEKNQTRQEYFNSCIKFLQTATSFDELQAKALELFHTEMFQSYDIHVGKISVTENLLTADKIALGLHKSSEIGSKMPVLVKGDGNCFPRSVSVACFGTEDYHVEVRVRIAIEMCVGIHDYTCEQFLKRGLGDIGKECENLLTLYTMFSDKYLAGDKITPITSQRIFAEEALSIVHLGKFMGIWQFFAVSSVLGCKVQSLYPDLGSPVLKQALHRQILPRENHHLQDDLTIAWSSTRSDMNPINWIPNHFVPLIALEPEKDEQLYTHMSCNESILDISGFSIDADDILENISIDLTELLPHFEEVITEDGAGGLDWSDHEEVGEKDTKPKRFKTGLLCLSLRRREGVG